MKAVARFPLCLVCAALVYLALRASILLTNFDAVAMPRFELATIGNLAEVQSSGVRTAPLVNFYDNGGGHLAVGLLAAPLYGLFGPSYWVLKLVPLALGLFTLVAIWWILARWWSRSAANLAVWFFALPAPTLLKYSLLAKGNHFENLGLQLVVFALFLQAHTSSKRVPWLLALGLAAGLAVAFYFGALVLVAALCVTELALVGWRRSCSDLARVAPGFALGLAPLAWIESETHGRVSIFLWAKFGASASDSSSFWSRLTELVTQILPHAGAFEDLGPIPARVAELAFLVGFVVAWVLLARRFVAGSSGGGRARFDVWKNAPFVLHLPLVALVFGCSTFDFDVYHAPVEVGRFRYLVPHFAFATMLFGVVAAGLWQAGGWNRVGGGVLTTVILLTGLFSLPIVDWRFSELDLASKYPGACFHYYADVALEHETELAGAPSEFRWRHARVAENLAELPPSDACAAYEGVGHRLAQTESFSRNLVLDDATLERMLAPYDPTRRVDLARGFGSYLRLLLDGNESAQRRLARNLEALARSTHPSAPYVIEGLCIEFGYPLALNTVADMRRSRAFETRLPSTLREAWLRGRGIASGRLLHRGIERDVALELGQGAELDAADRPVFWFGVGWGLADGSRDVVPPTRARAWAGGAELRALTTGYGAALIHLYGAARRVELWDRAIVGLSEEEQLGVARGMRWSDYPAPIPP